jgi:hypothetical protein
MPAISSTLPAPMRVAGSGRERLCMTSAAMRAPAPATSSRNSAKDSSTSNVDSSLNVSGEADFPASSSIKIGWLLAWAGGICSASEPAAARRAEDTVTRVEAPAGPARRTPTRTAVSSPWPEPELRGCPATDRDCLLRAIVAPRQQQRQTERQQEPVQSPSVQPPDDARASRPGCLPRWKWRA